jgi:hypothetical protein
MYTSSLALYLSPFVPKVFAYFETGVLVSTEGHMD